MKTLLDPIWGWPWTLLIAVASLMFVVATYRPRIAHLAPGARRWLLGLRIVAWSIVLFAMLRPELQFNQTDPRSAKMVVLTDKSRSMTVKDGPGGISRRDWLLQTIDRIRPQLERAGKEVEVQYVEFAEEGSPVERPEGEADGTQTAMGSVLGEYARQAATQRIVRILLLGDGAQRAVPPQDADPRAAATRLAEQNVRIDTVCFGAAGLSDTTLDLIVEDLEVSPTVFVKNTVVVSGKIRVLGGAGREVVVRLLLEDPVAVVGGQTTMKQVAVPLRLTPSRNEEVLPIEMSFVAEEPGEFRLMLEAVPLEEESLKTNNSLTTYLTVLKGGISVAYFDIERAEQRLLRRIDESPHVRLDFKPIRQTPGGAAVTLEPSWFELGKYDVYIIGGVPARIFGAPALERLAKLVEQGGGLLMTGGTYSFGPGGYANTPVADVLPIEMLRTEAQFGETIDESLYYGQTLGMRPTIKGLSHYVMRLDEPARNLERWQALPPLKGANKFVGLKPGALVLAESEEGTPLLVAQDVGRGRTMAFAGYTSFYWYQAGFPEAHQRFWEQVILWLAHKDAQGDQAVWLKLDGRRFRPGQAVPMAMGARDPQSGPLPDADFKIEVTGPDGKKHAVSPQRSPTESLAKFTETAAPGEYKVHVDAMHDGNHIGLGADARFAVVDQDLELHNPAADLALMEELSRITAGSTVTPEELKGYLKKMLEEPINIDFTRVRKLPLWDNLWLLLVFAGVLTGEWWLRKKRGLV